MKKLENLGNILSKEEQKGIVGGDPPGGGTGCSQALDFCGVHEGVEYKCCTDLPRLTCVNNLCETSS